MPHSGRVRGYVLAGGLSSRMGESKAGLRLGRRSFLEIAVGTMREATAGEIGIVGVVDEVLPGTSRIAEEFLHCGPMSGIAAALRDCIERGGSWAVFLPVDLPVLPGGLFRGLVEGWTEGAAGRVGMAVVEGEVQPLVSAIHVELLPQVRASLERGEYKIRPMLRAAARVMAAAQGTSEGDVLRETVMGWEGGQVTSDGEAMPWRPTSEQWARREIWFANVNTPEELARVRSGCGSIDEAIRGEDNPGDEKETRPLRHGDRVEHLKAQR